MAVEVDFQAALFARLNSQIVGSGKAALSVHDVKPQSNPAGGFPYVTIGESTFTMFDAQGSFNFDVLTRIHTWSRAPAMLECKGIQGDIYAALHDHDLTLSKFGGGAQEWRCYSLLRESSFVVRDPDQTFHGVCEYRALIQAV